MRKYESNKRIDLTQVDQYNSINKSNHLKSVPKLFSSYSRSSKQNHDSSDNLHYQCVTDRSRGTAMINQFNPRLSGYCSPKQKTSKKLTSYQKNKIQTYVRFRPSCKEDFLKTADSNLQSQTNNGIKSTSNDNKFISYQVQQDQQTVLIAASPTNQQSFKFNKIFTPDTTQDKIYQNIGHQLVHKFISGFNATIFAYGQTGSGKTYTMLGSHFQVGAPNQNKGLIFRAIDEIFVNLSGQDNKKLENNCFQKSNFEPNTVSNTISITASNATSMKNSGITRFKSSQNQSYGQTDNFKISCSMLEIYKQNLIDLLSESDSNTQLKIKQNNNKQIQIDGLSNIQVSSRQQIVDIIKRGNQSRKVRETALNDHSSRSHLIFTIYLKAKIDEHSYQVSKFNFVDLAGSEKVSKTKVEGEGLEEAKKINLSLSCLSNTINALSKGQDHVPFRDSKLTRILQQSLSGSSITKVIINCSILEICKQQTISSLKFGNRIKKIKLDNSRTQPRMIMNKEKSVDKYIYNMLLNNYQQSEQKLCRIKEIVVSTKNSRNIYNHSDLLQSVCKVIQDENNQQQQQKQQMPSQIQKTVLVSKQSKQILNEYANITGQDKKRKQFQFQSLLQQIRLKNLMIIDKDLIIQKQKSDIVRLQQLIQKSNPEETNKLSKNKKPSSRLKIVKNKLKKDNKQIQNSKNAQKQNLYQQSADFTNTMTTMNKYHCINQQGIQTDSCMQSLRNKLDKFINIRQSFVQVQIDVLHRQVQLLVGQLPKCAQSSDNLGLFYQKLQDQNKYLSSYLQKVQNLLVDHCSHDYKILQDR